jgi:hypothetical protein
MACSVIGGYTIIQDYIRKRGLRGRAPNPYQAKIFWLLPPANLAAFTRGKSRWP